MFQPGPCYRHEEEFSDAANIHGTRQEPPWLQLFLTIGLPWQRVTRPHAPVCTHPACFSPCYIRGSDTFQWLRHSQATVSWHIYTEDTQRQRSRVSCSPFLHHCKRDSHQLVSRIRFNVSDLLKDWRTTNFSVRRIYTSTLISQSTDKSQEIIQKMTEWGYQITSYLLQAVHWQVKKYCLYSSFWRSSRPMRLTWGPVHKHRQQQRRTFNAIRWKKPTQPTTWTVPLFTTWTLRTYSRTWE